MPSTSLDTSVDPSVDDPEAPKFVHNDSAFRGPLESGGTSPRTPRSRRRNSWLGSVSENEGFFRKWVEEPLGFVSDETTHSPVPNDTPSSVTPRVTSENVNKKQSSTDSPARPSKPVTWDSSVINKLGLHARSQSPQRRESDANEEDNEANGVVASREGRPPAARLASRRWAMIKNRLAPAQAGPRAVNAAAAVSPDVNISDELLGGGLATLMLKMHFDRDEQNKRRVPVLLHHLKIRVSDSVNPLQGTHTAFRIEVMQPCSQRSLITTHSSILV